MWICIATVIAKVLLLNKVRNDVVSHKCSPIAAGERIISHRIRRNEIAECLNEITHRCRHSNSQRRHKSVPISGGINTSKLYSTGNLWSRRVDSRVHKLDGFPHGVMVLLLWRERAESTSVLLERFWWRESLAGFHHFYVSWEKWSEQNRISHSHWVKICDDHNDQINLRAKQKYEVLSATSSFLLFSLLSFSFDYPLNYQFSFYIHRNLSCSWS